MAGVEAELAEAIKQVSKEPVKWYGVIDRASREGNGLAVNSMGQLYEDGVAALGLAQDYGRAMQYYRQASLLGVAEAHRNMGWLYHQGLGVPADVLKALQLYKKAAKSGDATAMNNLGHIYEHGDSVPRDYAAALDWYRQAAALGLSAAMESTGRLLERGRGGPKDLPGALRMFVQAAEAGDADACLRLAKAYAKGEALVGGLARPQLADRCVQKAAALDAELEGLASVQAAVTEALALAKGADDAPLGATELAPSFERRAVAVRGGSRQSYASLSSSGAIDLHGSSDEGLRTRSQAGDSESYEAKRQRAQEGDVEAMLAVAACYMAGAGGAPNDHGQARHWYLEAAKRGHQEGQVSVAIMMANGDGGPPDDALAAEFLQKACDHGSARAAFNLGALYLKGRGGGGGKPAGLKLLQRAADLGSVEALVKLAGLYEDGVDPVAAPDLRNAVLMYQRAVALDPTHVSAFQRLQKAQDRWRRQLEGEDASSTSTPPSSSTSTGPSSYAAGSMTQSSMNHPLPLKSTPLVGKGGGKGGGGGSELPSHSYQYQPGSGPAAAARGEDSSSLLVVHVESVGAGVLMHSVVQEMELVRQHSWYQVTQPDLNDQLERFMGRFQIPEASLKPAVGDMVPPPDGFESGTLNGQAVWVRTCAESVTKGGMLGGYPRQLLTLFTARHPHVVSPLGFVRIAQGRHDAVFKWVMRPHARLLREYIAEEQSRMSNALVVHIMRALASTVFFFHVQRHEVCRNVRSSTVLLRVTSGWLNALHFFDVAAENPRADPAYYSALGKDPALYYLAPELAAHIQDAAKRPGPLAYSYAADIFALGVVLWELLTRQTVHRSVYTKLIRDRKPFSFPETPWAPNLVPIIQSCLSLDPAARPSISAVLDVLMQDFQL